MTTNATMSNRKIRLGSGASPQVYTDIEEVTDISGLGAVAELLDATSFDSGSNREYIGGKSDGVEFTVECNDDPTATNQVLLRNSTTRGSTVNLEYAKTDQSPEDTLQFDAVYMGFTEQPSPVDVNKITFTFKVTGDFQ